MKSKILHIIFLLSISIISSQTLYTVHDYDDCKTLAKGGNPALVDVTIPVSNPDATDTTNPNVTELSPNAKNASVYLTFPVLVDVPSTTNSETFSFSVRYYTTTGGTIDSGSGRMILRLFNKTVGASSGNYVQFPIVDKVGGSWQTVSVTDVSLDGASQAVVDAGGYDSLLFVLNNAAAAYTPTNDDVLIDDLKISKNPALSDETSDLESGNEWIFNYSPDDFNKYYTQSEVTVEEGAVSPTTVGNDSPNVFKVTRGDATNPFVNFEIDPIDYRSGGKVKFRIYTACDLNNTPNIRFMLRDDNLGASQISTPTLSIIPNQWNEVEIDLATLAGGAPEADGMYNNMLIFFNFGDSSQEAVGRVFYLDAFQAPSAAVLSNDSFTINNTIYLQQNPVKNTIKLNKEVNSIEVYNSLGQSVLKSSKSKNEYNISTLSNGIYILKINSESSTKTLKFIKQ